MSLSLAGVYRVTLRDFYRLTKPGIIYGNNIAVVGGFLLASRWNVDDTLLIATVLGISFIMASGCVFNNYIDRDIDAVMERTKHRALVEGRVTGRSALIFGVLLYIAGALLLATFVNSLSLMVATFGFATYVFLYSLWSKRYTVHSTIIGALAGAVPPVVGYTAVTDKLDVVAALLFAILAIWQLPHAFAIAIYRIKDYTTAAIPVLSVTHGVATAKWALIASVAAFSIASALLWNTGHVGDIYLVIMSALSLVWLLLAVRGLGTHDDTKWGRSMFRFSLIALLVFCALISLDTH